MIHIVKDSTGKIMALLSDGSDVSSLEEGFTAYHDRPYIYNRDRWRYVGSILTEKIALRVKPLPEKYLPADGQTTVRIQVEVISSHTNVDPINLQLGDDSTTGIEAVTINASGVGSTQDITSEAAGALIITNPNPWTHWFRDNEVNFWGPDRGALQYDANTGIARNEVQEAKDGMGALPGWATWTPQQGEDWVNDRPAGYFSDEANLRSFLANVAKAVLYLIKFSRINK